MTESVRSQPTAGTLVVDRDRRQYRTLADFVRDALRHNIAVGVLEPGFRLVEREIAAQLEVSRMPVREAIGRLVDEGLVEMRPHGQGAVVANATEEELHDFLEMRLGLECWAVQLAAERIDDAGLLRLEEILAKGLSMVEAGDFETSRQLGQAWHDELALAAGNEQIVRQLQNFNARVRWGTTATLAARGRDTWDEHRQILEAIRRGDGAGAAKLVRAHMQSHERLQRVMFSQAGDQESIPES
jgi:DNA-binding GntR family transcriptional regulator